MAILADENTRILIQGITGREAVSFTRDMLAYGSNVVAGVTPGKGGQDVHGVPVYDTVRQAVEAHGAVASVVSVPPAMTKGAALEAIANGIKLLVLVAERVPLRDTVEILEAARRAGVVVIGPNTLGLINPGKVKIGMAGGPVPNVYKAYMPGPVGIASRSGGMTTEIANLLTAHGIGQSSCISVGGDRIVGCNFLDLLPMFDQDPETRAVVLFCEPGGVVEEEVAEAVRRGEVHTPIVAFVAGKFVDQLPGVRFGHAATIVEGSRGSVAVKVEKFRQAGVRVAEILDEIVDCLRDVGV